MGVEALIPPRSQRFNRQWMCHAEGRFCDRSSRTRPAGWLDCWGGRQPFWTAITLLVMIMESVSAYPDKCRPFLAQHCPDRLVTDPECGGQFSQRAIAGFAADDRFFVMR